MRREVLARIGGFDESLRLMEDCSWPSACRWRGLGLSFESRLRLDKKRRAHAGARGDAEDTVPEQCADTRGHTSSCRVRWGNSPLATSDGENYAEHSGGAERELQEY